MKYSAPKLRIRNQPLKIIYIYTYLFHGTVASFKNETVG